MIGRNTPLERSSALNRRSNGTSKSIGSPGKQAGMRRKGRPASPAGSLSSLEEQIVRKVLAVTQDFMDSPEFHKRGAARTIYKEHPEIGLPDVSWYRSLVAAHCHAICAPLP